MKVVFLVNFCYCFIEFIIVDVVLKVFESFIYKIGESEVVVKKSIENVKKIYVKRRVCIYEVLEGLILEYLKDYFV